MKLDMKRLFENNRFLIVFSLVVSAVSWLMVNMTLNYTTVSTISNVPVRLDTQAVSTTLANLGLHAIDDGDMFVTLEVEGLRSVVGGLGPENFTIIPRLTGVTEAATYELTLTSADQTPNPDYSILSITPNKVSIHFDNIGRMSYPVEASVNGLAIAPDYTADTMVLNPDTINITGPQTELDRISRVSITAELANALDRTYSGEFPVELYDANGQLIDPAPLHLTLDKTQVHLMIPVLKQTNLPLEVTFLNIPRGFPTDKLMERVELSPTDVRIAGPEDLIAKISEIKLNAISIKNLALDNLHFEFDVPLPEPARQFKRIDNVTKASVTIDDTGLSSAEFNVGKPQLVNVPAGFKVEMLAAAVPNVTFVGEQAVLDSMTADDIVAEIDLSERVLTEGSSPYPVKISVPGKGLVWAVGDHTVAIEVTAVTGGAS